MCVRILVTSHSLYKGHSVLAQRITQDRDSCQRRKKVRLRRHEPCRARRRWGLPEGGREGRWRVKYGDAQSNRMMRVSHHLWSFQHIDLITAIQCYSIRPQKVGFPGAKFQCKGNMDGGMRGRSALQKQSRPRIQTSPSGTVRGGKKKGRGLHANSVSR